MVPKKVIIIIFATENKQITIMKAYHKRLIDQELIQWSSTKDRKPLLLRGARQVGKTSAVHHFAKHFDYFAEVDFNERKDIQYLFEGSFSPQEICQYLSIHLQTPIISGKTLLFFDEIQACPAAINRLRYFYEKYPELHLIAAGSLLEFALEELPSYGVGRIRSLFMYPFSFEEFLWATNNEALSQLINQSAPSRPLPPPLHEQALKLLRQFLVIGGMPAVVSRFCDDGNLLECQRILSKLIQSFRDDFAKYRKRVPSSRIDATFRSVAEQGLGKFVYNKVDCEANTAQIRTALETLILAGLVYPVTHTSANGIPLGAEINEKYRRMLLCDTGLAQRLLNLEITDILSSDELQVVNRGSIAEMFIGTELIKAASCYSPQPLYCWHREKAGSNAEVDYVVQVGANIYPIEVKSGMKGSMQSMRLFMKLKNSPIGIRSSLENFCTYEDIDVYPLYAIKNIFSGKRLIK